MQDALSERENHAHANTGRLQLLTRARRQTLRVSVVVLSCGAQSGPRFVALPIPRGTYARDLSIDHLSRPAAGELIISLPSKVYLYNRTFRSSAASLTFYPHAHTRHESLQIEMLHAWDGTRYSSFHPILYEHLWIRYRKQGVERRISHVVKMSSLASLLSANTFQNLSGVVVSKQRLRTGMKTQFFNPNVCL